MSVKSERLETERILLVALLARKLQQWLPGCLARPPAQLLEDLPENLSRFRAEVRKDLRPYLAAMGVDAANAELMAAFDQRLRSAADVLERILRHRIEAAETADFGS